MRNLRLPGFAWLALAYLVLLEAMLVPAVLFWPELASHLPMLRSMTSAIPIASEMFDKIEDKGVLAYILGQHFFKGCNAIGTAAAVLFAAPAIAGEAQRGTLEILLARPFSRTRLLLERYALGALALVLPVFLTSLTIPALAAHVGEHEELAPYLWCSLHESLFLLAIYGTAFLGSSLGSNPTRISQVVLFLAVFEFAIYMVKTATHWSLFRLCDMDALLDAAQDERLDPHLWLPLVLFSLLALGASWLAFQRRVP